MTYVSKIRARRIARRAAAEQAVLAATAAKATVYLDALTAIDATTSAIKVPNGTTKKIARIVGDALATA